MTEQAALIGELRHLQRAVGPSGIRAPYKYVVLRWALQRALAGHDRLTRLSDARSELAELLNPVRIAASKPKPADPWFALRNSSWWELQGVPRGATETTVGQLDLAGGLSATVYDLVVADPEFSAQAQTELERLIVEGSRYRHAAIEHRPPARSVSIEIIDLERRGTDRYAAAATEAGQRQRREALLQDEYTTYLVSLGHEVKRQRIVTAGGTELLTDIYDVTDDNLIEVKADTDRATMRLALGQILDYARYITSARKSVLVPAEPEREIMDLFAENGIDVIWPAVAR